MATPKRFAAALPLNYPPARRVRRGPIEQHCARLAVAVESLWGRVFVRPFVVGAHRYRLLPWRLPPGVGTRRRGKVGGKVPFTFEADT